MRQCYISVEGPWMEFLRTTGTIQNVWAKRTMDVLKRSWASRGSRFAPLLLKRQMNYRASNLLRKPLRLSSPIPKRKMDAGSDTEVEPVLKIKSSQPIPTRSVTL